MRKKKKTAICAKKVKNAHKCASLENLKKKCAKKGKTNAKCIPPPPLRRRRSWDRDQRKERESRVARRGLIGGRRRAPRALPLYCRCACTPTVANMGLMGKLLHTLRPRILKTGRKRQDGTTWCCAHLAAAASGVRRVL